VTGGKPIAVLLQSISGVLLILQSPFTTSMEERERCYSFVLSLTPHEMSSLFSVTNAHYRKISSLVMLSWYFDMPEGVTYMRSTARHAIH
jgi:hypothetical protein